MPENKPVLFFLLAVLFSIAFLFSRSDLLSFQEDTGSSHARTQNVVSSAVDVKLLFIRKAAQFIDWPGSSTVNVDNKPFVIGVIGNDYLYRKAVSIINNKTFRSKIIKVIAVTGVEEILRCNVLFIANYLAYSTPLYNSESEKPDISKILSITQKNSILSVGFSSGLIDYGIDLTVFVKDRRINFEINASSMQKSGLEPDTRLLRQATRVIMPEKKK